MDRIWADHALLHRDLLAAVQQGRVDHAHLHDSASTAMEIRMAEHQASHSREHTMNDLALRTAERTLAEKLEKVNEFRQTLTDQATTFARSETMEARLQGLQERMEGADTNLDNRRNALEKQLSDRVTVLERAQNTTTGRSGGSAQTIVWILAGLSAAGVLLDILFRFTAK